MASGHELTSAHRAWKDAHEALLGAETRLAAAVTLDRPLRAAALDAQRAEIEVRRNEAQRLLERLLRVMEA